MGGFGIEEILVFLGVLGVLVFVHELGHFVAAKICNIYVDRFSLGMPPRLFGFRYGETDYCVGLLPIGGYVKMAGQEDQPLSEEEREKTYGNVPPERWYNNKPTWQRAFVLVAGPAMNLLFAIVVYAFLAGYGREVPYAQITTSIGAIEENSAASEAALYKTAENEAADFDGEPDAVGWRTGDTIVSVDGKPMNTFQDVVLAAVLSGGDRVLVEIERNGEDGLPERYLSPIVAKEMGDEDIRRFGLAPYTPAIVRHVYPASPAAKGGLQPDDRIVTANGEPTDQYTFVELVRDLPSDAPITLEILRDDATLDLTLQTRREGAFKDIAFDPPVRTAHRVFDGEPAEIVEQDAEFLNRTGLKPGEVLVAVNGTEDIGTTLRKLVTENPDGEIQVQLRANSDDSSPTHALSLTADDALRAVTGIDLDRKPVIFAIGKDLAESTGLKRKDRIVEIAGKPATLRWMRELEQTHIGETLPVTIDRPPFLFGLLQKRETIQTELTIESIQQIGVMFGTEMVVRREKPADILPWALGESYRQVRQLGTTLSRLLTGKLSPQLLGGPVMIGDVVTTAYNIGFFYLLDFTAMISINLAVFNLLPLPVLDGGQLLFVAIEAIRRRPVSVRVMETVQQLGFVFIIGLLLYVTFNDVSRIFERIFP